MKRGTEPSLGYWCALVGQQYFSGMRRLLANLDMDRWYFALVQIAEAEAPITQQQLADRLHLDKATMVRAIDHLSSRGYVARKTCPNDRRKHHLELLPKAAPVIRQIRAAYAELNDTAMAGLDAAERRAAIGQLQRMLRQLNNASPAPLPNARKRTPKTK
ncbi:MAG: MarR family transcriptional regulator [Flavobacteriales bacterium]|nr:MarR family transcriptional regulator [Flavobacteriales bacterium]